MAKSAGLRRATDMHWTVFAPGCKTRDFHPVLASSTTEALLSSILGYSVEAQPDPSTISSSNKPYLQTSKAEGEKSWIILTQGLSSQAFFFIDRDLNKRGSIGAFQTNTEGQIFLCLQGVSPQWQQHRMASQQGSPEGQISSLT